MTEATRFGERVHVPAPYGGAGCEEEVDDGDVAGSTRGHHRAVVSGAQIGPSREQARDDGRVTPRARTAEGSIVV